jgi:pyroglutamyl-peptidase
MGSEGPSVITVHVTGFKKFHGVAENPTEKIVSNLKSFMEKRGLPKNLVLGSCTILETAGEGALSTLYKVLETAIADRENGPSAQGHAIWVSSQFTIDLIICSRIKINQTALIYFLSEIYVFSMF